MDKKWLKGLHALWKQPHSVRGNCEDSSDLSWDRHCQHTFDGRVVCFYLMSTQLGDASVPIWYILMSSSVHGLSWSIEELIVLLRYFKTSPWIELIIFCSKSFMLSYLPYLYVQNKKNLQKGEGQAKNLWPSLQDINLLDITLSFRFI